MVYFALTSPMLKADIRNIREILSEPFNIDMEDSGWIDGRSSIW